MVTSAQSLNIIDPHLPLTEFKAMEIRPQWLLFTGRLHFQDLQRDRWNCFSSWALSGAMYNFCHLPLNHLLVAWVLYWNGFFFFQLGVLHVVLRYVSFHNEYFKFKTSKTDLVGVFFKQRISIWPKNLMPGLRVVQIKRDILKLLEGRVWNMELTDHWLDQC